LDRSADRFAEDRQAREPLAIDGEEDVLPAADRGDFAVVIHTPPPNPCGSEGGCLETVPSPTPPFKARVSIDQYPS
jgi:hypothetical protein